MLLALGFTTFGDLLDSPNVNAVNLAIVADDSDADLSEAKCCFFSQDDAALFSVSRVGKAASIQILSRLLDTSSTARYKLLSVYRI